jgi:small subunit ribosomal protein S16
MTEPAEITVDAEKVAKWIERGAKPTDTVAALLRQAGVKQ